MLVELCPKLLAALCQSGEPAFGEILQLFALSGEFAERRFHRFPQRLNLTLARRPEFVEPVETADHIFELGMGGTTGVAAVVGDVLARTGDDRDRKGCVWGKGV